MTSPDLIVIGAQKCGTTTVYEDLGAHPSISLTDKESSVLLAARESDMRTAYARVPVPEGSFLAEVSTEYAMRPLRDVARTAAAVAPEASVAYIVRDPVARVISHHHHEMAARTLSVGIDDAVREHRQLIDYSRYAFQIRPWLDAFGPHRVHVLRFEEYMSDRATGSARLYSILGRMTLR